jgi:ASC-1-like (ASCH) protein
MNKEIVIITAHCDDQEKIDTLIECIDVLKSEGYPIIISSHIQVPDNIYNMVDYVIYDKENPLIYSYEFEEYGSSTTWFWSLYDNFYQKYTLDFNHAYAVLKLIKNGVALAQVNGYQISHVVCYDYILNDKNLLSEHTKHLEEYDVFSYFFKDAPIQGLSAGLFSFKNDIFLKTFSNINTKKEYSSEGYAIFEQFLEKTFLKYSAKILKIDIDTIRENNVVDKYSNIGNMSKNIIEGKGLLFLSKIDDSFYIYFVSFSNSILNIIINDNTYKLNASPNRSNLIPISKEQLKSGIKIDIPEFNLTDFYNIDSRFSQGRIDNDNIIKNIEDYKIYE